MIRAASQLVPATVRSLVLALLVACSASRNPAAIAGDVEPAGRTPDGASVRVEVAGARVGALAPAQATTWLWPPIIDSHVHLAYWPVAEQLAASGIGAVVDLAGPERALPIGGPLPVLASGPMLTSVDGYPLDSWGADGYGIGCADAACVTAAIDRLAGKGVRVIKLALDDHGLDPALIPGAVAAAHAKQLKVAVHALSDRSAALAAAAGVDLLAHTPVEPLRPETVAAWRGRAVISTLAAFGGSDEAIANLRALRAAGATVLYGTDLGNLRDAGPSAREVALLAQAGLDDAASTAAMTTTPAAYWGLPLAIAPGNDASFLVLDRDPRTDARTLLAPRAIWLRGRRMR
jgi:hypothetical protein